MLSAGALEMGRLYYVTAHTDFFSAHTAGGHKCKLVDGEACSLCLQTCGCSACLVRLMFRMLGGKETS